MGGTTIWRRNLARSMESGRAIVRSREPRSAGWPDLVRWPPIASRLTCARRRQAACAVDLSSLESQPANRLPCTGSKGGPTASISPKFLGEGEFG